jgi:hypothetical protein
VGGGKFEGRTGVVTASLSVEPVKYRPADEP